MMTSYIWHCFCTYCTKNTGVYYISALSCYTAPVRHNSLLSKTKSIRPRLRPRPKLQDQDQDRGRSETSLVIRPRSQTPRLFSGWSKMSYSRLPRYWSCLCHLTLTFIVHQSIFIVKQSCQNATETRWNDFFNEIKSSHQKPEMRVRKFLHTTIWQKKF